MIPAAQSGAPEESRQIKLSIIIVSWNVRDLLKSCLLSIANGVGELDVEVIVVDSDSADGTIPMLKADFPWIRLIEQEENVGFPRGNNIGLAEANGRFLLLLNPDTELKGDALTIMASYLENHPEVGIVGPKLFNPDGTLQSSRRRFPTFRTALFESTWLQPLAPRSLLDHYYAAELPDNQIASIDWLVGACIMTRRDVYDEIGPLDEDYFMYSEELDWCRRAKLAGWQVVYLPDAEVVHHHGKSSEQAVTDRHINFQRAKLRYFRKYHGRLEASLLRSVILFNYLIQVILELLKGLIGHKRPLRWQRVRAYWKVLRSGLRPAGY